MSLASQLADRARSATQLSRSTVGKVGIAIEGVAGTAAAYVSQLARMVSDRGAVAEHDPATAEYAKVFGQAEQEIGRINVLVAGNTRVGKSTLVNAIFGEDVAAVSTGLPVTQTLTLHEAPNSPLNLWDSRGFEAGDGEAVNAVEHKLAEMRSASETSAQIHVPWLCISSEAKRVEPVHLVFLRRMAERRIPTIVVWTQTYESLDHSVRALAQPAAASVELLAADRPSFGRQAFNLDKLVEETDRVLPEARKAAFAAAQKVQVALKKTEANPIVMGAVAAAGASAVVPLSSVCLAPLQVAMLAKIDALFGRALFSRRAHAVAALSEVATAQAGRWVLGSALGESLKASGVAYPAGVAINAAIGASVTGALGFAYVEALARSANSGIDPPIEQIVKALTAAVRQVGARQD